MSRIDVRDLQHESLPRDSFPADPRADFRCFMAPAVRHGIEEHAKKDDSVEICGVLVGRWGQDDGGPFAAASDYIRCENAASKFAEVTFTHESWAQINKEMDTRFADLRIVGWYHSHPNFGIFLSDRDCFIQEHFFSGPGQVAYVIDPVRNLEGVFAWRNGKPQRLPHFWIGDTIQAAEPESSQRSGSAVPLAHPLPASNVDSSASPDNQSWAGALTQVLSWLAVFLMGYLYASWWASWESEMIEKGAVAHFGDQKLIRLGWEQQLGQVQARLAGASNELRKLPKAGAELKPDELKAATKQRKLIGDNLILCQRLLTKIEQEYGLSLAEREMLARMVALKQAELRKLQQSPPRREAATGAAKTQADNKSIEVKDVNKLPE